MKYAIIIIGEGEGCDYTIGCNQKLVELEATDLEAARVEAKEIMLGEYDPDENEFYEGYIHIRGEDQIESAQLVSIVEDLDIDGWLNEALTIVNEHINNKCEAEERALLKKLKEKYEG